MVARIQRWGGALPTDDTSSPFLPKKWPFSCLHSCTNCRFILSWHCFVEAHCSSIHWTEDLHHYVCACVWYCRVSEYVNIVAFFLVVGSYCVLVCAGH